MKKRNNFFTLDRHHAEGFTLVELIVVIAILAILGGVAVPAYSGYVEKAEQAADDALLASLNTAYAAACATNGENHIGRTDASAKIGENKEATVTVSGIAGFKDAFELFYESEAFKYYDVLGFDSEKGLFVGNTMAAIKEAFKEIWNNGNHTFSGKEEALLKTFDAIGDIFGGLSSVGGVDLGYFLGNFSDELLDVTGLNKIFGEVNGAMNLTNEQLHEYLLSDPGYAAAEDKAAWIAANPEKVATVKGNVAVMQFAQDAATASSDAVKNDVNSFVAMVNKAKELDAADVDYEAYYLKMCSAEDREYYLNKANDSSKEAILNTFLNKKNPIGLTGAEAARWEAAAELTGASNATGTSTLGSLYALAAGYYASIGEEKQVSTFPDVWAAMNSDGFADYYTDHGTDNIEAYLSFMGSLSGGEVDMTDPDAFGGANGMGGYISGILGN